MLPGLEGVISNRMLKATRRGLPTAATAVWDASVVSPVVHDVSRWLFFHAKTQRTQRAHGMPWRALRLCVKDSDCFCSGVHRKDAKHSAIVIDHGIEM